MQKKLNNLAFSIRSYAKKLNNLAFPYGEDFPDETGKMSQSDKRGASAAEAKCREATREVGNSAILSAEYKFIIVGR